MYDLMKYSVSTTLNDRLSWVPTEKKVMSAAVGSRNARIAACFASRSDLIEFDCHCEGVREGD